MKTASSEIRKNIKIGEQLFESLLNEVRPGWAGQVLSQFDPYLEHIPPPVKALFAIIDDRKRWKEAHGQFSAIRDWSLRNTTYKHEAYIRLAELVAKVTYNASGEPAAFDHDSGHHIASMALTAAEYFNDKRLEEELAAAILGNFK